MQILKNLLKLFFKANPFELDLIVSVEQSYSSIVALETELIHVFVRYQSRYEWHKFYVKNSLVGFQ